MSSDTWTPTAVSSNKEHFAGTMWRMVNKEGKRSTGKVVDTASEIEILEALVHKSREIIPVDTGSLHRLLATPFKVAALRGGSRFRAEFAPGVFYAADSITTAAAEKGYHQYRFLQDSPEMERLPPSTHSLFSVEIQTDVIDVRASPYDRDSAIFTDPNDYSQTQKFAQIAREANVGGIVYKSVRNPKPSKCIAVLKPSAFAKLTPSSIDENWELTVHKSVATWFNSGSVNPPESITFIF